MNGTARIFALAAILGAAGMWLLLPRGTTRGKLVGTLLALFALGLWGATLPRMDFWIDDAVFFVLAGITVIAAAIAVSLANPVYCAIWFGMSLVGTASLFLYQGAQFLAVATVVIYAGAILVIFLFVLMLAQPQGRANYDRLSWEALVSATTGVVLIGVLTAALYNALAGGPERLIGLHAVSDGQLYKGVLDPEHVARLGTELFGRHLIAVEVVGVLLLAALVGAAAIAMQTRSSPPAATPPQDQDPIG